MLLLLISLQRALPALIFNSLQPLRTSGQKLRAVRADKPTKENSRGTGVCWVTGDGDPLAGFDRIGCPTDFRKIQPAGELDGPLRDLPGIIGDVYEHHRVRIDESELSHDAHNGNDALFIVDG